MSTRRNPDFLREAKFHHEEVKRLQAKREQLQLLHAKKQERIVKLVGKPSEREFKIAIALDVALAKTQAQHKYFALILETDGMTPQESARWMRHRPKN